MEFHTQAHRKNTQTQRHTGKTHRKKERERERGRMIERERERKRERETRETVTEGHRNTWKQRKRKSKSRKERQREGGKSYQDLFKSSRLRRRQAMNFLWSVAQKISHGSGFKPSALKFAHVCMSIFFPASLMKGCLFRCDGDAMDLSILYTSGHVMSGWSLGL